MHGGNTMAVRWFGGPAAGTAVVDPATGKWLPGDAGTVWDAPTGGAKLALIDGNQAPIADGVIYADSTGYCQLFGTDTDPATEVVWIDFTGGLGKRVRLECQDRAVAPASADTIPEGTSHLFLTAQERAYVAGLPAALQAKLDAAQRGAAGGVAPLGSDGLVPAANLPATSAASTPPMGAELSTNPGFEDGLSGHWVPGTVTYAEYTTLVRSGSKAAKLTLTTANLGDFYLIRDPASASANVPAKLGATYRAEFWVATPTGATGVPVKAFVKARNAAGSTVQTAQSAVVTPGAAYSKVTIDLNVTDATAVYVVAGLSSTTNAAGAAIAVDDQSFIVLADAAAEVDAVDADLQSFKTMVPTNEDLVTACPITRAAPTTTGGAFPLMVAPFDMTILSVDLAFDGNVTGSDTNYWSCKVTMRSVDGSAGTTVADRTTQLNASTDSRANGGITAWKGWNFDAAAWSTRTLLDGQLLYLNFSKAGTPDNLPAQFTVTIRYQRKVA